SGRSRPALARVRFWRGAPAWAPCACFSCKARRDSCPRLACAAQACPYPERAIPCGSPGDHLPLFAARCGRCLHRLSSTVRQSCAAARRVGRELLGGCLPLLRLLLRGGFLSELPICLLLIFLPCGHCVIVNLFAGGNVGLVFAVTL